MFMTFITLAGVSRYKQAFSTGVGLSLLVRSRICCCSACLDRDFANCLLKVETRLRMKVFNLAKTFVFVWIAFKPNFSF